MGNNIKNQGEQQMLGKNKKEKKNKKNKITVKIYCVAHKTYDEQGNEIDNFDFLQNTPLTYVATEEEAYDYCRKYFFLKHYDHFKLWCNCHNQSILSEDAWNEYVDNIIESYEGEEPDEPLCIFPMEFTPEELAKVLRFASFSLPVGGDWETDRELPYIQNFLKDDEEFPVEDASTIEYNTICSNLSQFLLDAGSEILKVTANLSKKPINTASPSDSSHKKEDNDEDDNSDNFKTDIFA